MTENYDLQGWLPADLAPTQPIWSQPNNMPNVPNVNEFWDRNTPVGKWNMTGFNYNIFESSFDKSAARFCALNKEDFNIPKTDRQWLWGQVGDVFPNCYQRQSDIMNNQNLFAIAQEAQTNYAAGKYDAVSEINREDPYHDEPCANKKSILEVITPIAGAILAAVGTGIVLSYGMPNDAPQALKSISVVGALAFGFGVGSAIVETDSKRRREIFQQSSAVLGTAAGADASLIAAYIVLPNWQDHEYIWIAIGGATGYFVLAPLILPYIDNYLTGIFGFVFRLLDDVAGLFGDIACQIGNWDIDGCTRQTNTEARSWDRVLFATALVEEMAKKNDMDDKEKQVAFQALLLNAASFNTYQDPWEVATKVWLNGTERKWNSSVSPDARLNAYSVFGPLVQANTTNDPAWYEKLSGGANYEYYFTMFTVDKEAPLLQRCAPLRTLIGDTKIQEWMDDAYKLAKKGKMQVYPRTLPKYTFSCDVAYLRCMQEPNESSAYELARLFVSNYLDIFTACRQDPAKLKFIVWWDVFLLWREPATGAERVIAENYELTKGQDPLDLLKEQEIMAGIVAIFRHFKLDTTIGDNVQAQEIWRFWLYCAQKDRNKPIPVLPTACQEDIYHIERNDPTYAELGKRAAATGSQPIRGCSDKEQAKIAAWRKFDFLSCDETVAAGVNAFKNNPNKESECGYGEAFLAASDYKTKCGLASQNQVEQWVAACSQ